MSLFEGTDVVDVVTVTTLMSAEGAAWETVLRLLGALREPPLMAFSLALLATSRAAAWLRGMELFQTLRRADLFPEATSQLFSSYFERTLIYLYIFTYLSSYTYYLSLLIFTSSILLHPFESREATAFEALVRSCPWPQRSLGDLSVRSELSTRGGLSMEVFGHFLGASAAGCREGGRQVARNMCLEAASAQVTQGPWRPWTAGQSSRRLGRTLARGAPRCLGRSSGSI